MKYYIQSVPNKKAHRSSHKIVNQINHKLIKLAVCYSLSLKSMLCSYLEAQAPVWNF